MSPAAESDARLRLTHAGRGLVQRGAGLIEPELGVAMIQLADDLPPFDEIADIHGRGDDAPGNQRRDIAGFVGYEVAGLLEGGRDGAGNSLRRRDGHRLRSGRPGGRGGRVALGAAGQKQGSDEKRENDEVDSFTAPLAWVGFPGFPA